MYMLRELDGPAVSALRRAIAEVKQRWSVIGWVTKNLLSRALPYFGRLNILVTPPLHAKSQQLTSKCKAKCIKSAVKTCKGLSLDTLYIS
jgi:hypothetical protein